MVKAKIETCSSSGVDKDNLLKEICYFSLLLPIKLQNCGVLPKKIDNYYLLSE